MHIMLFFMYYLRPGDSGHKRFNDFFRVWLERDPNMRMTVFTGSVNHYTGEIHTDTGDALYAEDAETDPGGTSGRVRVLRVRQADTYGKGFAGKAWSQVQWSRNCQRILRDWQDAPDLIIASSPPLWAAEPMIMAKRKWKVPAIFEEQDLWPESIVQLGVAPAWHPGVLYLAGMEKRLVRTADHFVAVVRTAKNSIVQRGLKPEEHCSVFTNGIWLPKFDDVDPASRAQIRAGLGLKDDDIACMYIGQLGKFQRVMDLVEVADLLRGRRDLRFFVLGDGPDKPAVQEEALRRGLENLEFLPIVGADEVPRWLKACDIGLGFLNSTGNIRWNSTTRGVMPGKMYDYGGARLPVVFNAHGLTRDVIETEAGGGIFASTLEGVGEYAAAVERLADDPQLRHEMGQRNYEGVAAKYSSGSQAEKYLELLYELVPGSRP
ncbi:MAG: glycosyltransferase family 4 protein [bacterium]